MSKYGIRDCTPEYEKMEKGIAFNLEKIDKLYEALGKTVKENEQYLLSRHYDVWEIMG